MPSKSDKPEALLRGTLDMLILRTLQWGPAHGHDIAKHIQRSTEDVLQVEHGSLYPALHRMEEASWISAKWTITENKRRARIYEITRTGKKQLAAETLSLKSSFSGHATQLPRGRFLVGV